MQGRQADKVKGRRVLTPLLRGPFPAALIDDNRGLGGALKVVARPRGRATPKQNRVFFPRESKGGVWMDNCRVECARDPCGFFSSLLSYLRLYHNFIFGAET